MNEIADLLLAEFIEACEGVSGQHILIYGCGSEGKALLNENEGGQVCIKCANILGALQLLHNCPHDIPPLRARNHLLLRHHPQLAFCPIRVLIRKALLLACIVQDCLGLLRGEAQLNEEMFIVCGSELVAVLLVDGEQIHRQL